MIELDALGLDDEPIGEGETPSYLQDAAALPDFVDAAPVEASLVSELVSTVPGCADYADQWGTDCTHSRSGAMRSGRARGKRTFERDASPSFQYTVYKSTI